LGRVDYDDVLLCPKARKPGTSPYGGNEGSAFGSWTFSSGLTSSYGFNTFATGYRWVGKYWDAPSSRSCYWRILSMSAAGHIPAAFDCIEAWAPDESLTSLVAPRDGSGTPRPSEDIGRNWTYSCPICINRHEGGINMAFLDGSARKVGLKELWTLKWHTKYNTANEWTKAGGVQPGDWPEWMRKFKDY
jgi:prepilin-type processing-associated H-X9-DG protein